MWVLNSDRTRHVRYGNSNATDIRKGPRCSWQYVRPSEVPWSIWVCALNGVALFWIQRGSYAVRGRPIHVTNNVFCRMQNSPRLVPPILSFQALFICRVWQVARKTSTARVTRCAVPAGLVWTRWQCVVSQRGCPAFVTAHYKLNPAAYVTS